MGFRIKTIKLEGKRVQLQIWDTAGRERFDTLITSYIKGTMVSLIVYTCLTILQSWPLLYTVCMCILSWITVTYVYQLPNFSLSLLVVLFHFTTCMWYRNKLLFDSSYQHMGKHTCNSLMLCLSSTYVTWHIYRVLGKFLGIKVHEFRNFALSLESFCELLKWAYIFYEIQAKYNRENFICETRFWPN